MEKKERKVIPGCDAEGVFLDKIRRERNLTQSTAAALVGQGQNIWTQWQKGTTRILDEYWLVFARELGFNPYELRPGLREIAKLYAAANRAEDEQNQGADTTASPRIKKGIKDAAPSYLAKTKSKATDEITPAQREFVSLMQRAARELSSKEFQRLNRLIQAYLQDTRE